MERINSINIKGVEYKLPIFLPDATLGVVKGLSASDLSMCNVRGCVVNTFHLFSRPGGALLNKLGGIKKFMGFDGLFVSDSGGWQVFSLIHRNKSHGEISDEGVTFSFGGKKSQIFTPEESIQMQFEIGSDIIICLDDFTPPNSSEEQTLQSVQRTTLWAKRSKEEYLKQLKKRNLNDFTRPLIFSVIQGDRSRHLRKKSATELIEIGFDGYGYGGYMIDEEGNLDMEISKYIASLIPDDKVSFALGFGKPWQIASLYALEWDIFDCTLPTRDARHGRLYTFKKPVTNSLELKVKETYDFVNIMRTKYQQDPSPISEHCKCYTCRNYSKAYIHHLYKIKDISALRLATIHNLYFYNEIIDKLIQ